jgi:hypothetical protein
LHAIEARGIEIGMSRKLNPDNEPSPLRREAMNLWQQLRQAAFAGGDHQLASWLETNSESVLALLEARIAKRPAPSSAWPAVPPPPNVKVKHRDDKLTTWPSKRHGSPPQVPNWAQAAWTRLLKAGVDDGLIRKGLHEIHAAVYDPWGRPALVKDGEAAFKHFWDKHVDPVIEARERAGARQKIPGFKPRKEPNHIVKLGDDFEVTLTGAQWRLLQDMMGAPGDRNNFDQYNWTVRKNKLFDEGEGQLWATNGHAVVLFAVSKAPLRPESYTEIATGTGTEPPDIDAILRPLPKPSMRPLTNNEILISVGPEAARILAGQAKGSTPTQVSAKFSPSGSVFWNTLDPILQKYGPKHTDWTELPDVNVDGDTMVGFNVTLLGKFARYWPDGFKLLGTHALSPFLVFNGDDRGVIGVVMPMRID